MSHVKLLAKLCSIVFQSPGADEALTWERLQALAATLRDDGFSVLEHVKHHVYQEACNVRAAQNFTSVYGTTEPFRREFVVVLLGGKRLWRAAVAVAGPGERQSPSPPSFR